MVPVALLLLLVVLGASQAPVSTPPAQRLTLISDNAKYSNTDGVIEIQSGSGWLRTEDLLFDFDAEFEFRAATPEIDAGLMVRTLGWPRVGYRLKLPTRASDRARSLFRGRGHRLKVLSEGRLVLSPHGEWQKVRVSSHRRTISVMINDVAVGEFDVERSFGLVMFENRKGTVQFRNISIRSRDQWTIPPDVMTAKQLTDAGGEMPTVAREVKPDYTSEAMREKVRGAVELEVVVLADGSVGAIHTVKTLHPHLDLNAIAAVREWKFRPARLNGNAVPVVVNIELTFTLK